MELTKLAVATTFMSALALPASAFGNDNYWVSGFGQGTIEATVLHGPGNSIYVACEAGSLIPSSISFSLGNKAPTGSRITLTFDRNEPESIWISDGAIPSDCRACAANFTYVLEKFKRHNQVHVLAENGDGTTFSLKGSSNALDGCSASF